MEGSSKIQVLVTCGGGLQGMTAYKSLKALEGLVSHLFDCNTENVSKYFYDHFFQSPPVDQEEQYEEELIHYCSRHKIDLIVPVTQFDLLFLSRRKKFFREQMNCRIAVPDEQYVNAFLNKRETNAFLKGKGFPVQEERDLGANGAYPLIGKPLHGWGGKGRVILKTISEFSPAVTQPSDFFWTDYLEDFREYSIDFAVNAKGKVSDPLARERLVVSGGLALVSQSVALSHRCLSLIERGFADPAMSGVYNLQYISTKEGDFFTDLNPRIGTSAVLGDCFSSNPIGHLLGIVPAEKSSQQSIKVVRYLEEKYLTVEEQQVHGESPKEYWDNYSIVEAAKQGVMEKGFRKGASKREMEIAREMKKEGIPISQIIKITGLTQEQIEKN